MKRRFIIFASIILIGIIIVGTMMSQKHDEVVAIVNPHDSADATNTIRCSIMECRLRKKSVYDFEMMATIHLKNLSSTIAIVDLYRPTERRGEMTCPGSPPALHIQVYREKNKTWEYLSNGIDVTFPSRLELSSAEEKTLKLLFHIRGRNQADLTLPLRVLIEGTGESTEASKNIIASNIFTFNSDNR